MLKNNKTILLVVGLIIFAIIIIVVVISLFNQSSFKLLSTNPGQNEKDVSIENSIIFTFSKELSQNIEHNQVSIDPSISSDNTVNNNEIIINPKNNLKPETTYSIKISNINSVNGEKISDILLSFTSGKDNSPKARFIRSLPYNNPDFSITYIQSSDSFTITLSSKDTQKAKTDALNYIRNQGLNPDTLKITIVEPRYLRGPGSPPG